MPLNDHEKKFFIDVIDELVLMGDDDKELKAGLQYCDEQSKIQGLSFYEICYRILYKREIRDNAKRWLDEKSN